MVNNKVSENLIELDSIHRFQNIKTHPFIGSFMRELSSVDMAGLKDSKDEEDEWPELPLLYYRKSADKKSKPLSEFYKNPAKQVKSNAKSNEDSNQRGTITMESMSDKEQVGESNGVCATPGSVVWAKKKTQTWWPAEVIGEASSEADSRSEAIDGCVLVQFYGDRGSAWVDPARDLSRFEDCFEERSCNTGDKFQDALKHALKKKEQQSSQGQSREHSDKSSNPSQHDRSSEKCTSSSSISSKKESMNINKRKCKKKQEESKICQDTMEDPVSSARKVRRFRIMRNLGLMPPIGSPY